MRMTPSRAATLLGAPVCLLLVVSCYRPEPLPQPRPRDPGVAILQDDTRPGPPNPIFPSNDGRYGPLDPGTQGGRIPYTPPLIPDHPADNIPVARRTDNPNRIISPFPPYNVVDVTGFKSGDLAHDPTLDSRPIFRVP